jgi:HK97 family phage portal protein
MSDLYGALTRVIGGMWPRYGGWGWSRVRYFMPGARFDYEREAGDLWTNSVAALGINWLGNRFPRPIMKVSKIARNGDHIPLGRHAAVDLWKNPNPWYSRRTLEKAIGLSLIVDGNAYIYKVRSSAGKVVQLWWIPQFRCLPTWPGDGSEYIDGFRVWLDTAVYHLPPEDVIHIRDGIDPRNERLGLSALRSNIREVCTVNSEASYTASLMRNGGFPGVMIIPDDSKGMLRPNKDDAELIKQRFHDSFGQEQAGSTMVMAGPYKVEKVGFSPEEMRLDRLPANAMARIGGAVGVALMCLGLPDAQKTYANLEEATKTSWGTICSIQELVAEALDRELLPEFGAEPGSYCVEYDYSMIQELQESEDAIYERAGKAWDRGLMTRNEGREMMGLEPDDEFGDDYKPGTGGGDPASLDANVPVAIGPEASTDAGRYSRDRDDTGGQEALGDSDVNKRFSANGARH